MNPHPKRALLFLFSMIVLSPFSSHAQFRNFVTVKGDQLMDGDRVLRFISVNVPNLHYNEDFLPFDGTNPWRLPDEFEIRDALTSVKQLGGKVARIYVFSVRRDDDEPGIVRYIEGPGKFNERAFAVFDTALKVANETGVRLIVPFVDNWRWWGGPKEYAEFRGRSPGDFWTDPEVIGDFKKTIEYVINRTNKATGVPYKDDKAILAWETGNELAAPYSWTKEIAAYVKSLDTNHLLVDGTSTRILSEDAINDPHLDILTTHHYYNPQAALEAITENRELTRGKKPYFVGEYGLVPSEKIRIITDTIINRGLAGGMIWSLRTRNRDGGFYFHYEYNNYESYHWPGFTGGAFYDEQLVLSLLHEKAYRIDTLTAPLPEVPAAPRLLSIANAAEISWQGSAGADSYTIARRTPADTSWSVIAKNVDENRYQYRPLYNDTSAVRGMTYFYRVKARNTSGESEWSNIVGPIVVGEKECLDEMENFDYVFQKDGDLELLTSQDLRRAREDRSRLTGSDGSYIVYKIPPTTNRFEVDILLARSGSDVRIFASMNPTDFTELNRIKKSFDIGKNDYDFYVARACTIESIPTGTTFIKVVLENDVQISRIKYTY